MLNLSTYHLPLIWSLSKSSIWGLTVLTDFWRVFHLTTYYTPVIESGLVQNEPDQNSHSTLTKNATIRFSKLSIWYLTAWMVFGKWTICPLTTLQHMSSVIGSIWPNNNRQFQVVNLTPWEIVRTRCFPKGKYFPLEIIYHQRMRPKFHVLKLGTCVAGESSVLQEVKVTSWK